jgi:replication-associated recombination protein RarA
MEKFKLTTRKGYDFFECSSAFQKCIRRGLEHDALFFGTELAGSGYAKYLWKRIFVIVSEDIGLANDTILMQIQALYHNWQIIAEKNLEEGQIPIVHAILLLVRSPKSRIVDNVKMFTLKSDYKPEIPDFALDVHTRRGKMKGRSYEFFLTHGSHLENEKEVDGNDFYKAFFTKYLEDYQAKKCTIQGYDEENLYLSSPKQIKPKEASSETNNQLF